MRRTLSAGGAWARFKSTGYTRRRSYQNITGRGFDSRRLHAPVVQGIAGCCETPPSRGFFMRGRFGLRVTTPTRGNVLRRFVAAISTHGLHGAGDALSRPGAVRLSRDGRGRHRSDEESKGPRNGPGPRGAENLNRFRERLDGTGVLASARLGCWLPCLHRCRAGRSADQPHGLQAGGQ